MFDIGWTELLVIAVVLIVVVGPKDLPPMLRAFGKMTTRARKVAGEFRAQFDEAMREAELDDVQRTISEAKSLNPVNTLRDAMNPLRQMGNEIKADLQRSTVVDPKPATETASPAVVAPEPSMSLPETPPVVPAATAAVEPAPLLAPETSHAPAAVALASTATPVAEEKPKPVRKPRVKAAEKPAAAVAAAPATEKPKRTAAASRTATSKTAAPRKAAATKKDKA